MQQSIDRIWEEIHRTRKWGAYPPEHVIRFAARNFYGAADRSGVKILDFGCGQGANTWYLAREGFDVYAFDGSESAVEKAEAQLSSQGLNAHFRIADGIDTGYENDFFDAVIDNVCIYSNTMKNIKIMYSSILNMLKPGGKLLTVVFGEDLFGYGTGKLIEPGTYTDIKEGSLADRGTVHIFKEGELPALLEDLGFINISCDWCRYTDRGNMVHQYICTAEKKGGKL